MPKKIINRRESGGFEGPGSVTMIAGFLLSLLLMAVIATFLLTRNLIPWPFHGADTVFATYGRILIYLPFAGFSFLSVLWIKRGKQSVSYYFTWPHYSPTFLLGLVLSGSYSLYLFLTHNFVLKGLAFVPPAMLLVFLNAFSEEFLFRLVFFQLLIPFTGSWQRANLIQAVVYGFVHLLIGGPVFFLGAVGYGFLLGWITRSSESILPAIICHFIADIGAIGLPLLIIY